MSEFIAWCGFAGAWLLVAGPIHQAALELEEEQAAQREQIRSAAANVEHPPSVSPWWWFLPPVKYVLERRRSRAYRESVIARLEPESLVGIVRYIDKARGWLLVALGALCIAVRETWEVREAYEWPLAVFVVLMAAMFACCVVYVVVGARHRHRFTAEGDPP